jgi:hypothetical protein
MLLGPRRPLLVRLWVRFSAPWNRDRGASAADLRYLDTMSNERLARDLGLVRSHDRRYHPY